jgi:hypothetical protein
MELSRGRGQLIRRDKEAQNALRVEVRAAKKKKRLQISQQFS